MLRNNLASDVQTILDLTTDVADSNYFSRVIADTDHQDASAGVG